MSLTLSSLGTFRSSVIAILMVMASCISVHAAPTSLTYQGRILKSDGKPLENSGVSFLFEITNPSGSCVIFREQVNGINMTNSNGIFDIQIGASHTYPASGTFSILDSFNNNSSFTCDGGVVYNPGTHDERRLRVQFHDGSSWKVISPDSIIRSVPFAAYSESARKLGTHGSEDFVLKTEVNNNATCDGGSFLTWDATTQKFGCAVAPAGGGGGGGLTSVTSTNNYLSVTNGTTTPSLTVNVGQVANTVAAGNDSRFSDARTPTGSATGDLSGTYPSPSVAKIQGRAVDGVAPLDGQVLLWDNGNTTWKPQYVRMQDVRNAWGGTQMIPSASCAANEAMVWSVVTDRFTCQAIGSLNASVINAGTIAPARLGSGTADNTKYLRGDGTWSAISTTDASKLPLSGGTMSGDIDVDGHKVLNISNVPFVATNPTVTQDGQSLRWNNTTAKWEWFTAGAAGAGISSLNGQNGSSQTFAPSASASSYGFSSNTNVHTLSIPSAATNGVTAGTISKSEYDSFNSKLDSSSSFSGDVSGTIAATSVDKIKGKAVTLTTPTTNDILRYNGTGFVNTNIPTCSAGNYLTFNGTTFSCQADVSGAVTSVAGRTGAVVLSNTDISGLGTAATRNVAASGDAAAMEVVLGNDSRLVSLWDKSGSDISYSAGSVAIGTASPNSSSALEISSNSKGFLLPRLTTAQRNAIASPATGLTIYNKDKNLIEFYNGSQWYSYAQSNYVSVSASGLAQAGSGVINFSTKVKDTNSEFDLTTDRFQPTTAGTYLILGYMETAGQADGAHAMLGVLLNGTAVESAYSRASVSADIGSSISTVVTLNGTTDYVNLSYNVSSGTVSRGRFIAYPLSTTLSSGGGGADNLGNHTASQNIIMGSNWISSDGDNEGINIGTTGNVGIGIAATAVKLEVAGQVKITGGTPGNGKVLTSDASGLASWQSPAATGITSLIAGTGLTGGTITSTGTMAVDVGTGANQIPQLDGSGKLDSAVLPSSIATTSMTLGGDLSGNLPNPTVAKIQNRAVASTAPSDGQALLWDNGNTRWTPQYVRMQDIRNAWGGTQMIPSSTCTTSQAMVWNVITDRFICQTISESDPKVGANTTNYLSKWNGSALVASGIFENAGNVGIGTSNPGSALDIKGDFRLEGATSGYAALRAPATAGNVTWTLPSADGSSGQILQTNGSGVMSWISPAAAVTAAVAPSFSVSGSAGQTVTAGVSTKMTFSSVLFDSNNNWASNRFTPTVSGKYIITVAVNATSSSLGDWVSSSVLKNGATYMAQGQMIASAGSQGMVATTSIVVDMNGTTDYIEAMAASSVTTIHNKSMTGALLAPLASGSVAGTGTAGYLPMWSNSTNLANSPLAVSGANVGIGTNSPVASLDIYSASTLSSILMRGTSSAGVDASTLYFSENTTNKGYAMYYRGNNYGGGVNNQLQLNYSPDNVNSHTYFTLLPNNATDSTPGDIIFPGKVGIGTTSNTYPLEVKSASGVQLRLSSTGANAATMHIDPTTSGQQAAINFYNAGTIKWQIGKQTDNTFFIYDAANARSPFLTSAAGNVSLVYGGGLVGVGKDPNSTYRLDVLGNGASVPVRLSNGNASTTGWMLGPDSVNNFVVYNSSGTGAYISNGGTSWVANSDIRIKKDLLPIEDGLNKALQLRGMTYLYTSDKDSDPRRVGVIAQDVQKVLPEAVERNNKTGILGVKYTEIIPLLIEAIKGLNSKVDRNIASIQEENASLKLENAQIKEEFEKQKKENAEMKSRLDAIEKALQEQ